MKQIENFKFSNVKGWLTLDEAAEQAADCVYDPYEPIRYTHLIEVYKRGISDTLDYVKQMMEDVKEETCD